MNREIMRVVDQETKIEHLSTEKNALPKVVGRFVMGERVDDELHSLELSGAREALVMDGPPGRSK